MSGAAVGFVSLGCPKALVDSEQILSQLRAEGYTISPGYEGADVVVVNTCGFIDAAVTESLEAIEEALNENGRVIVTGCLGAKDPALQQRFPELLAVTGPHATREVMQAIHEASPPEHDPYLDLLPPGGIKLTPRHYAYLKISEGCNHRCTFCIIPDLRGDLVSRPIGAVIEEAEQLVSAGVRELLVVSQDTSAYGIDLRHRPELFRTSSLRTHIQDLAQALGQLDAWVRLHYVYPYPHVDELIPLMAEGLILPYLDIPFQHASHSVLRDMKRPAHAEKVLHRIEKWRRVVPDLALRSTFIVGFPGESEADFEELLDFLDEARLDRVGAFTYSPVEGARANALPDQVDEEVKQERLERFMRHQANISAEKLQARVGQTIKVIIDELGDNGAIGRSQADAPEIDGVVHVFGDANQMRAGDIVEVKIEAADEHDLQGVLQ